MKPGLAKYKLMAEATRFNRKENKNEDLGCLNISRALDEWTNSEIKADLHKLFDEAVVAVQNDPTYKVKTETYNKCRELAITNIIAYSPLRIGAVYLLKISVFLRAKPTFTHEKGSKKLATELPETACEHQRNAANDQIGAKLGFLPDGSRCCENAVQNKGDDFSILHIEILNYEDLDSLRPNLA